MIQIGTPTPGPVALFKRRSRREWTDVAAMLQISAATQAA
jgi:hypothetical protein